MSAQQTQYEVEFAYAGMKAPAIAGRFKSERRAKAVIELMTKMNQTKMPLITNIVPIVLRAKRQRSMA